MWDRRLLYFTTTDKRCNKKELSYSYYCLTIITVNITIIKGYSWNAVHSTSEMSGCFDCLCKQAKKHYEKAFRDAEKAQDAHKRAENDVNLSKADVEKVDYHSCV